MANSILVVGGGFSGITAALEAAEVGYEAFIIEKNPYLGGRVAQLNKYFPKLCPPSCGLEIQFQRIRNNPLVKVHTMAEVVKVEGGPGNYTVTIKVKPRYVNERCTACGDCEKVCETELPSEFDFGLGRRKAIYKPNLFAFPMRYVFDKDKVSNEELVKIMGACTYKAVEPNDEEKTFTLTVGAIVQATGWKPYDVTKLTNLGAGAIANCVSNMQFERLAAANGPTKGKIVRPSDLKPVRDIAFVQCAGSRDQNHLNFCSYICCMASLKQAMYLIEQNPGAKITIYYIDLRTPGRYDKFKKMVAAHENVTLVKGKVAAVEEAADGGVVVTVEDAVRGLKKQVKHDMLVLATGMAPSAHGKKCAGAALDEDGFGHGDGAGIFSAGCCTEPLDVMRTAQSATAAAMKAIQTVVGR